jgi:uncharacterized iron-regulated membrane protein
MRVVLGALHRWAGLFIGVFLIISGLSGAIISWDHELDEWLNPELFESRSSGAARSSDEIVSAVEASDKRVTVVSYPLRFERGHNAALIVGPRVDPQTGELYKLDYNQVYVDPVSLEIAGTRMWGKISLARTDILPFLYKLHYSMHIPAFGGIERWGFWFMGIIAIVWTIDCFVGLLLTMPRRRRLRGAASAAPQRGWWRRWQTAWRIKLGASRFRLNLDMHRVFGLWLWPILLVIAFSSISLNLGDIVVRPLLSKISTLTPDPFDDKSPPLKKENLIPSHISWHQAIDLASAHARAQGWTEQPASIFYGRLYGLYSIRFLPPDVEHSPLGMPRMLFISGADGKIIGGRVPWEGTKADIFMQLQFPLHSGRIAGLPGRILISALGIVVAVLSITGIVVWATKKSARRAARRSFSRQSTPAARGPIPDAARGA